MRMANDCIGWDIGGAHLKAARISDGALAAVVQQPCALWCGTDALTQAWRHSATALNTDRRTEHVITMTGELADCFADRNEGVERIVSLVSGYVQKPFKVYAGSAGFVEADDAVRCATQIASANWHATAKYLGRSLGAGILADIGTTTTDIVAFDPQGASALRNDHERLRTGELVYTGVVRTPVMALTDSLLVNGAQLPLVAELFATTADVYRILGRLPEHADQYPSCDGGEKTPLASMVRLARMFGCALGNNTNWADHAQCLADEQMNKIEKAYRKVVSVIGTQWIAADAPLVGAGVGRFLVRDLAAAVGRPYLDFSDLVMSDAGQRHLAGDCATAVGLAMLGYDL